MSPDLPNWLGSVKGSVERVQIDGRQWYKSKKPITASTVKLGDVPHGARLDIELSRPATISAGEVHPSAKLILHCPPSALTTIDAGFAEVEIQSTERAGGGTQVRLILGAHEMRLTLTGESFRLAGTSGLGKPTLQVHTRSSACSLSVQANATVTHVTADGALKFNLQHNEGLERIETIGDLNLSTSSSVSQCHVSSREGSITLLGAANPTVEKATLRAAGNLNLGQSRVVGSTLQSGGELIAASLHNCREVTTDRIRVGTASGCNCITLRSGGVMGNLTSSHLTTHGDLSFATPVNVKGGLVADSHLMIGEAATVSGTELKNTNVGPDHNSDELTGSLKVDRVSLVEDGYLRVHSIEVGQSLHGNGGRISSFEVTAREIRRISDLTCTELTIGTSLVDSGTVRCSSLLVGQGATTASTASSSVGRVEVENLTVAGGIVAGRLDIGKALTWTPDTDSIFVVESGADIAELSVIPTTTRADPKSTLALRHSDIGSIASWPDEPRVLEGPGALSDIGPAGSFRLAGEWRFGAQDQATSAVETLHLAGTTGKEPPTISIRLAIRNLHSQDTERLAILSDIGTINMRGETALAIQGDIDRIVVSGDAGRPSVTVGPDASVGSINGRFGIDQVDGKLGIVNNNDDAVVMAVAPQKSADSGVVRNIDVSQLPAEDVKNLRGLELLEIHPRSLRQWARDLTRWKRGPASDVRHLELARQADRLTELLKVQRKYPAAPAASQASVEWSAARIHHASLPWGPERIGRSVHRLFGYSIHPTAPLLAWFAASFLITLLGFVDVATVDEPAQISDLRTSTGASAAFSQLIEVMFFPFRTLRITSSEGAFSFLCTPLPTLAALAVGLPFVFSLVCLRRFFRTGSED